MTQKSETELEIQMKALDHVQALINASLECSNAVTMNAALLLAENCIATQMIAMRGREDEKLDAQFLKVVDNEVRAMMRRIWKASQDYLE